MDSTDKNDDLELLAALMDGKLSRTERARAIKLLADSDEALEVFASAARDEQLAQVPGPRVIPIWRRWQVSVPIAAAAAITLAVMPRLIGMQGSAAVASDFAMDLTQQPAGRGGAGRYLFGNSGWEQRGWSETRGAQSASATPQQDTAERSKRAFRLGVRTVDLQVALRTSDMTAARRVTDDITQTLSGVDVSGPIANEYSDLKKHLGAVPNDESIKRASSIEAELRNLLHSPEFESAQWIAAAELASRAHDASFFESKNSVRFVRSQVKAETKVVAQQIAIRHVDSIVNRGLTNSRLTDVNTFLDSVIQFQVFRAQQLGAHHVVTRDDSLFGPPPKP